MPRANRYFLPGHVWHITHRCHKQEFLLKFNRDRLNWKYWLFEAKKRYGLCVLNYIATSNHIHLLVVAQSTTDVCQSMQLIAGRTAQDYNRRKARKGAFWEDRYHATAIDTETHLFRCMVYIDLNMVRAGVVTHPSQWDVSGYNEILSNTPRYRIIDLSALIEFAQVGTVEALRDCYQHWHEEYYAPMREPQWSSALAVGQRKFVEQIQNQLNTAARYRDIEGNGDNFQLKESTGNYNAMKA